MDYIRFHCPACNHLLVVPPEAAGMSGPCPDCQTVIQGPSYSTPPQPQPLNPPVQEARQPPQPDMAAAGQPIQVADAPPVETLVPEPPPGEEPAASQVLENENTREPLFEEPAGQNPAPAKEKNSGRGGLPFLQALLLCFLLSCAFFGLGFYSGKTGTLGWEEIAAKANLTKQKQEPKEHSENSKPKHPEITVAPLPENDNTDKTDSSGAQAILEAFLSAGSWSARNAYVLYPNLMIPEMEACAAVNGDGPIAVESIILKQSQPNLRVFWIKTSNNSRPFSTVMINNKGSWLVDWSAFADFYHNRLQSFANGKEGPMRGIFRVFLKAAPGETAPLSPAHCLVMAPQSETAFQVNSAPDSRARKKLAEIFQAYLQADAENFREAMAGPGIPLIVELSRNGAPNPTLKLESIATTGWAPLPPAELKKEKLSSFY